MHEAYTFTPELSSLFSPQTDDINAPSTIPSRVQGGWSLPWRDRVAHRGRTHGKPACRQVLRPEHQPHLLRTARIGRIADVHLERDTLDRGRPSCGVHQPPLKLCRVRTGARDGRCPWFHGSHFHVRDRPYPADRGQCRPSPILGVRHRRGGRSDGQRRPGRREGLRPVPRRRRPAGTVNVRIVRCSKKKKNVKTYELCMRELDVAGGRRLFSTMTPFRRHSALSTHNPPASFKRVETVVDKRVNRTCCLNSLCRKKKRNQMAAA